VAVDGPDRDLEQAAADAGAEVVTLESPGGSYAARNLALGHLHLEQLDAVLFTDADCLPQPGWIGAHVAALESTDLSGGAIEIPTRQQPSAAEFLDGVRHLRQRTYVAEGYAATANLAVRPEVAALGFDGRLKTGGDSEFCVRARSLGYTIGYTEDAVVVHPARQTAREVMKKVLRLCSGVLSQQDRWATKRLPPLRSPIRRVRQARKAGASGGLFWESRLAALSVLADGLVLAAAIASKMLGRAARWRSRQDARGPATRSRHRGETSGHG